MILLRKFHNILSGIFLLLLLSGAGFAQTVQVTGIGLSGLATRLEIEVGEGDSIFVVMSFTVDPELEVRGVSWGLNNTNEIRVFFYRSITPLADSLLSTSVLAIDSSAVEFELESDTLRLYCAARLPEPLQDEINSIQIEAGLYATDEISNIYFSENRMSHVTQGEITAVSNSVDPFHATFLIISEINSLPVIHYPAHYDTVGRSLTIEYDQPLDASPGTLILEFVHDSTSTTSGLYLSDPSRGVNKQVRLDLNQLWASADIDSVIGPVSLWHDSLYSLKLGYRMEDGRPSDIARVEIRTDLETASGTFLTPELGTEAEYPDIPVLFRLNEPADTVWMTFEADSSQADTSNPYFDLLSPHIIALTADAISEGLHDFTLSGSQLGSSHPLVAASNRGPQDSLKLRTIYNVTLAFGDRFNNENRLLTNRGYVWPADDLTIPPVIALPLDSSADNRTFWVEFTLPEAPMTGTVRLDFYSSADPEAPHRIYLENHSSAGSISLMLNGLALDYSNPPVTRVEGGTSLLHNTVYRLLLFYQDAIGNPLGADTRLVTFDDATDPPVIFSPVDGDTLKLDGIEIEFEQPEDGIPGSVQLVLTQTAGEEIDPLSPRIVYLSDPGAAPVTDPKRVTIQPAFLAVGPGIDSVRNGGSLTPRSTYDLTVRYQDTLSNAVAQDVVRDLYFPSGSRVYVHGSDRYPVVDPGESKVEAFLFAMQAEGESSLRGVEFDIQGTVTANDINHSQVILWSSSDTIFSIEQDSPIDTLDVWLGGEMRFDSFAFPLTSLEQYFLVTVGFTAFADDQHSFEMIILDGTAFDCGGDPVVCSNCPIGEPDVPLPLLLTAFFTEQHTQFGSLKLLWDVASETNNEGFNVWRRDESEEDFAQVASFTDHPELYGRGTAASAARYRFIDSGLTPGQAYVYRLETVSIGGFHTEFAELEAVGTPQLPPDNFILRGAYPNPFNPRTTIEYIVPYVSEVRLTIFNLLGQKVRELVRTQQAPAVYRAVWDGTDDSGIAVPTGLYIYLFEGGHVFAETRKMLLVR